MPVRPRRLRGFTLTEVAIVVGVVSLVFGAIWVTLGPIQQRQYTVETISLISQVNGNVHNRYMGQLNATAALPTTAELTDPATGIFPGNSTLTPWGGQIDVTFNDRRSFYITLDGIRSPVLCAELLNLIPAIGTNGGNQNKPVPPGATPVPTVQNSSPTNAYFSNGGGTWQDETGASTTTITNDTAGGCDRVGFFYVM